MNEKQFLNYQNRVTSLLIADEFYNSVSSTLGKKLNKNRETQDDATAYRQHLDDAFAVGQRLGEVYKSLQQGILKGLE